SLALAGQSVFDGSLPFLRVRFYTAIDERAIRLNAGLVQTKFYDGQVRARRLKKIAKLGSADFQLCLIQGGERSPKMDEHEVALVSEQREQCRLSIGILFHLFQHSAGFLHDSPLVFSANLPPRRPAKLHHLM